MTEKIAVVTGAGTGVGRAVTLALMREGYTVVLAGRRKDMLEQVAKEGVQTPGAAAYTSTKHAVTGLTKQTSLDCRPYNICCGQIDIGNAATPLTERMVQGAGVPQPDGRMMIEPRMAAEDVGRAVVYMANLPLDTNVLFMTVMANLMPYVGRG